MNEIRKYINLVESAQRRSTNTLIRVGKDSEKIFFDWIERHGIKTDPKYRGVDEMTVSIKEGSLIIEFYTGIFKPESDSNRYKLSATVDYEMTSYPEIDVEPDFVSPITISMYEDETFGPNEFEGVELKPDNQFLRWLADVVLEQTDIVDDYIATRRRTRS
jgi:hypothetical protein